VNYWEGSVRVKGKHKGEPVRGRGYVELTGYDAEFRPDI
ncbi:MAG: lipocalin family protein, partial [Deltaproteobacteria bacterium]|nr:lipocalin family protein [Deltaproteobacteria bacterium]